MHVLEEEQPIRRAPLPLWPVLVLLVGATFAASLKGEILSWDDEKYLSDPAASGTTCFFERLVWMFTSGYFANYNPLHRIGYWVQRTLWGREATLFHLVSVALHGANVLLVYALAKRLGLLRVGAFAVAALFAVHPSRAEAVAWISAQKDLGSATFALLALLTYAPLLAGNEAHPAGRLAATWLLYKSMAVTFPLLLLALDAAWKRPLRIAALEKIPFFVLSAAFSAQTVRVAPRIDPIGGTWASHVATALQAPWWYLGRILWPFSYSPRWWVAREETLLAPGPLAGLAVLLAAGWVLVRGCSGSSRRAVFLAVAWPLACLLPVLNIVPIPIEVADRYLYLALLGPLLAGALAWQESEAFARLPASRPIRAAFAAASVATLSVFSAGHASAFRDQETFWRRCLDAQPWNPAARMYLAEHLVARGAGPAGIAEALELVKGEPFGRRGPGQQWLVARARVLEAAGRSDGARRDLERALELGRRTRLRVETAMAWAELLSSEGRFEEAHAILRECRPRYADEEEKLAAAHAQVALRAEDYAGYLRWNAVLIRRSPFDPLLWHNRQMASLRIGDEAEAARCAARFDRLFDLRPPVLAGLLGRSAEARAP